MFFVVTERLIPTIAGPPKRVMVENRKNIFKIDFIFRWKNDPLLSEGFGCYEIKNGIIYAIFRGMRLTVATVEESRAGINIID